MLHSSIYRLGGLGLIAALGFTAAACGDDDDGMTPQTGAFELIGEWTGTFGDESISETAWNGVALMDFDNDANVAITQNSPTAEFFPDGFNRIVYTEPVNDSFFYCTVAFGLDTLMVAQTSTLTADATAPATSGCGGQFPWSDLTRQ